jgi:phage terminase large subunit-like protein
MDTTTTRSGPSLTSYAKHLRQTVPKAVLREMLTEMPWSALARPEQIAPSGDWLTWLILAGRGWGKTRTGAEWVQANVHRYGRWILAGRTSGDLRDIMIEGESGILRIARPPLRPSYEPSKRRLTWPNGAVAVLRSADEPEGFRGLQGEASWVDELAAWEHPEAWEQLQLGIRLGEQPRQVVTTTPRPTPLIRGLLAEDGTIATRGSTYENRDNLSAKFFRDIVTRYEGTRMGRQELHAEILDDIEGALWKRSDIFLGEAPLRHLDGDIQPEYRRIVVAIDPAVTYGPDSDETGIVACGVGIDGLGYVLDDQSGRFSPGDWAKRAIALYTDLKADAIVAEVNNGGDMVEDTLRTRDFAGHFIKVTASRGKRVRAEPVAALYEQHRIKHRRAFVELEDQLCNFTPESVVSPDRLDALVWAFTELMLEPSYSGDQFSMIA